MSGLLILKLFFAAIISLLISFYLVPFCMFIARRLQFVDTPDGKIKHQPKAVPYLGGVAVFIGFLAGLVLLLPSANNLAPLVLGAALLLFVGLVDDFVMLRPYQKFFGQFIAVLCFLKQGFFLKEAFFLKGFWTIPVSAFWMLSIINAFNLVDVMDGLATSLAILSSFGFLTIALFLNNYAVAIFLSSFIGALLGFFWYNRPNAKIYLGDAGALFIGGILANIPFLIGWSEYGPYGLLAPLFILGVPIFEICGLVVIRCLKGIPFYYASPDHFSLCLLRSGWSKWGVLSISTFFSLILFYIGWTAFWGGDLSIILWYTSVVVCLWVFIVFKKPKAIFSLRFSA